MVEAWGYDVGTGTLPVPALRRDCTFIGRWGKEQAGSLFLREAGRGEAMLRCLSVAAVAVLVLVLGTPTRSAEEGGPLVVGKNVPASFHPYNVTARLTAKEEP